MYGNIIVPRLISSEAALYSIAIEYRMYAPTFVSPQHVEVSDTPNDERCGRI